VSQVLFAEHFLGGGGPGYSLLVIFYAHLDNNTELKMISSVSNICHSMGTNIIIIYINAENREMLIFISCISIISHINKPMLFS